MLGNQVSTATNQHATGEELLKEMYSTQQRDVFYSACAKDI
jgi:hypothetical protein